MLSLPLWICSICRRKRVFFFIANFGDGTAIMDDKCHFVGFSLQQQNPQIFFLCGLFARGGVEVGGGGGGGHESKLEFSPRLFSFSGR